MKIAHTQNYDALSKQAADNLLKTMKEKKSLNICLATGSSPAKMYAYLTEAINKENIDLSEVTFTKLDEWYGVESNASFTCETFIKEHILDNLHMQPKQFISFQSNAEDKEKEVARIEQQLLETPIDVMILGLGMNGHLGLNEPAEALEIDCHFAPLHEKTKTHDMVNGLSIEGGLTIGLSDIFKAKQIIFLISGDKKDDAFHSFMERKISTNVPASLLWLHQDCTAYIDTEKFNIK